MNKITSIWFSEMVNQQKIKIGILIAFTGQMTGKEIEMFTVPTIDMIATGQNVEKLRKLSGLSVRDLQVIFGFGTPQAIYKWQHGKAIPSIDNLVVLAAALRVKIDDILVVDTTM